AWAKRLAGAASTREASVEAAAASLLDAGRELLHSDPVLGRQVLVEALEAALLIGAGSDPHLHEIAAVARAGPAGTATTVDLLLDAYGVYVLDGFAASVELMRAAVASVLRIPASETPVRWCVLLTNATEMSWDQELHDVLAERLAEACQEQADLNSMAIPVW